MAHEPTESEPDDDEDADRAETDSGRKRPLPEAGHPERTDEHAVDPMAPGRSIVDPDGGDAVEPNEPA